MALQRKPFKVTLPECKNCGAIGKHYSWQCPSKRKKRMRSERPKNKEKRIALNTQWLMENPPQYDGKWECYLQISEWCPKRVDIFHLTFEHVIPKRLRPDLKFDISNIRPSCEYCNEIKGSKTLEKLSEKYPRLKQYLS